MNKLFLNAIGVYLVSECYWEEAKKAVNICYYFESNVE
jgi:hypothetical protein